MDRTAQVENSHGFVPDLQADALLILSWLGKEHNDINQSFRIARAEMAEDSSNPHSSLSTVLRVDAVDRPRYSAPTSTKGAEILQETD